jgi:hypothetical protein
MGRCLSITNALLWGKTLIEDKFMSDCFDKTEYLSGKTLYPNALGWSKSPMARQVAQWVSGFDYYCLVVQLRHASLIRLNGSELVAKKCTEELSLISAPKSMAKKDLLFNWYHLIYVTNHFSHLSLCAGIFDDLKYEGTPHFQ